ncbi:MAG: glycosyltransferase [Clostridia bacterium]|nr:glycosyltransferase [Clostridia bacterium]
MGISACLLAYKEAENLRALLPQVHAALQSTGEAYEIIVVDTQTPLDDTAEVCRELGARYVGQEEPYFGGAFRTAIKHASQDMFLIMDADGSHKPEYIVPIYKKFAQGADVVIGSRYVKGGKTQDSALSVAMSKVLNCTYRWCLGLKAKDISTDFRMYHTEQLRNVEIRNDHYDVLQEVLFMLKRANPALDIQEVPITFEKRMFGESKRRLLPFVVSYARTLLRLIGLRLRGPRQ